MLSHLLSAQPENNTCAGVVNLGVAPVCETTLYSNVGATPYDIDFDNNPSCFKTNPPSNDVWFAFTTAAENINYTISIGSNGTNSIKNLQVAIYRGKCDVNSMALRQCEVSEEGSTAFSFDIMDLAPSTEYFIRVDNYGGDENEGEFNVCVQEKSNAFNIDAGGSTSCSGLLYDSGGPDGEYQNNEDQIFTICPEEFHNCIDFTLNYYDIKDGVGALGDKITFYNGPSISSPLIQSIGTSTSNQTNHGGGGVCYRVQADQCITIRFKSDGSNTGSGFEGRWECSAQSCDEPELLKVSANVSKEDIEAAISTPLSKVTVDTIICHGQALGTFNGGDDSELGLSQGLLLTTGSPFNAIGPNNFHNAGMINDFDGDNDLDILSQLFGEGSQSFDACVVEMDVEVFSNELTFEYVFASEEYAEFVGREFNDVFALLISGPGIEGVAEINNQKNLAVLPNGENVQTNSVNHLSNWEYYRNNTYGKGLEYDGLTGGYLGSKKSLTASTSVTPCNTYRLKVAIADRGDLSYDSGVFIAEISSGVPKMDIVFKNTVDHFIESCSGIEDKLVIRLSQAFDDTISYRSTVSGTAEKDIDYLLNLGEEIIFLPGETTKEFSFIPIEDELDEGIETIKVELINDTECGSISIAELDVNIQDKVDIKIESEQDTIPVCENAIFELQASGGNNYQWSPLSDLSDPFIANPILNGINEGWLKVRGSVGNLASENCVDYDSVYIDIINPTVAIDPIAKSNYCTGESIELSGSSNITAGEFEWSTSLGNIINSDSTDVLYLDNRGEDEAIVLTQNVGGCSVHDTVLVNVDNYFFPEVTNADLSLCQGESIQVIPFVIPSPTIYSWSPATYLSNPNIANPIIKAEQDINYTLTATSQNGYCSNDTTINVVVRGLEINIQEEDTLKLCAGDMKDIIALAGEANLDNSIKWIFDQKTLDRETRILQDFTPAISDYLYAELDALGCANRDSIYISVDSLPNLDIFASPDKSIFCKDEIVTLITNPYVQGYYPDIQFQWLAADGLGNSDENLNFIFKTDETRTYVRETINGQCSSLDSFQISVFDFDAMTNIQDTLICGGQPLDVFIDSPVTLDNVSWDPEVCDFSECTSVTLTPFEDTDYTVVLQAGRCIDTLQFSVSVDLNQVNLITDDDPTVPLGETIDINATTTFDYDGNYVWYIDSMLQNENSDLLSILVDKEQIELTVEIYNDGGCLLDSESITISGGIPEIIFPNAFIPAGEEANQVFTYAAEINGNGFEEANFELELFQVFNRWGQMVFECDNIQCLNDGWDGRKGGEELPSEVYSYQFKATLPNGDPIVQKGTVTLIR